METVGRMTVAVVAFVAIGIVQRLFETWAGPERTISVYGFMVLMLLWAPVGWLVFREKKTAPTQAPGSGAGGER